MSREKRRSKKHECRWCDGTGKVFKDAKCSHCKGSGWKETFWGDEEVRCNSCDGTGNVPKAVGTCDTCGGEGKIVSYEYYQTCNNCRGTGKVQEEVYSTETSQGVFYQQRVGERSTNERCPWCKGKGKRWS